MSAFAWPFYHILNCIGLVLILLAAPFHFASRSASTILYIIWVFIKVFIFTLNGFLWHNRFDNFAPVWCDISSKLQIGVSIGITSAHLMINRRVHVISEARPLKSTKQRDLILDLLVALGLPVLIMIFHVIVQGHRADIIEGVGCYATISNVTLAYPLVIAWPLATSVAASVYGLMAFRRFLRRRYDIDQILSGSSLSLSKDLYLRLMFFSLVPIVFPLPLNLYLLLSVAFSQPVKPWFSWAGTHRNFNRFDLYPISLIKADHVAYTNILITLWSATLSWVLFFSFLGMGREQRKQYVRWFYLLLKPFGVQPPVNPPSSPSSSSTRRRTLVQWIMRRSPTPIVTPFVGGHSHSIRFASMGTRQTGNAENTEGTVIVIDRSSIRTSTGEDKGNDVIQGEWREPTDGKPTLQPERLV